MRWQKGHPDDMHHLYSGKELPCQWKSLCQVFMLLFMQHKVEEKNHKPVFLTFKIKQNFYLMRDSNNFLYNVTPLSALSPEAECSWSSGAGFFSYLKSDAKFIVLFFSKRYFNNIQIILLPCSFTEATVIKLSKQWSKMEVYCFRRRFMTYLPRIKKLHMNGFHNVFLDVKNNPAKLMINFYTRCY